MFGLGKFSPNIDEVQILIIYLHIWPPIIKKVEQLQRLFLVVWQTVRRNMQIYWKIGLLWYGAPTGGAANVLLELIFGQKQRGAILEFFQVWTRSWNKNYKSDCSGLRNSWRMSDDVFKSNEKLSERWRITPLGGAKHANFFQNGQFSATLP